MDEDDKYSLDYDFSKVITESFQKSVSSLLKKNILRRRNPFDTKKPLKKAKLAIVDREKQDSFRTAFP